MMYRLMILLSLASCAYAQDSEPLLSDDADTHLEAADVSSSAEDLKYNLAGLEWFLTDQEAHERNCPDAAWEQPDIDAYRKEPKSYLPEGCPLTAADEEEAGDADGPHQIPLELPVRQ